MSNDIEVLDVVNRMSSQRYDELKQQSFKKLDECRDKIINIQKRNILQFVIVIVASLFILLYLLRHQDNTTILLILGGLNLLNAIGCIMNILRLYREMKKVTIVVEMMKSENLDELSAFVEFFDKVYGVGSEYSYKDKDIIFVVRELTSLHNAYTITNTLMKSKIKKIYTSSEVLAIEYINPDNEKKEARVCYSHIQEDDTVVVKTLVLNDNGDFEILVPVTK